MTDAGTGTGRFDQLPAEEPFPGVRRASFSSASATVSRYEFAPGATFPLHAHPQEQVTIVEDGSVEMTVAGETILLEAGAWSVVGPGTEHGITAGSGGARIFAVVTPRRESADEYELSGGDG